MGAGILTVDEVRANMGLAPLPASANAIPSPVKKNFRKSDDGDDEDDSEDDDEESDDEDSGDGGDEGSEEDEDFNAAHPRWPAGSPGGIGGEFAPKDSGVATQALHDAISMDAEGDGSNTQATDLNTQNNVVPDSWGNPGSLQRHVDDHAADFGIDPLDPDAATDYANQANEFLQRSFDEGLPTKIETEGYMRVYDPESNIFGSYNPDGTTRTFYSPPAGQAYFDDQPGELYIGDKPVSSVAPIPTVSGASDLTSEPVAIEPEPLIDDPIIIEEPIIIP